MSTNLFLNPKHINSHQASYPPKKNLAPSPKNQNLLFLKKKSKRITKSSSEADKKISVVSKKNKFILKKSQSKDIDTENSEFVGNNPSNSQQFLSYNSKSYSQDKTRTKGNKSRLKGRQSRQSSKEKIQLSKETKQLFSSSKNGFGDKMKILRKNWVKTESEESATRHYPLLPSIKSSPRRAPVKGQLRLLKKQDLDQNSTSSTTFEKKRYKNSHKSQNFVDPYNLKSIKSLQKSYDGFESNSIKAIEEAFPKKIFISKNSIKDFYKKKRNKAFTQNKSIFNQSPQTNLKSYNNKYRTASETNLTKSLLKNSQASENESNEAKKKEKITIKKSTKKKLKINLKKPITKIKNPFKGCKDIDYFMGLLYKKNKKNKTFALENLKINKVNHHWGLTFDDLKNVVDEVCINKDEVKKIRLGKSNYLLKRIKRKKNFGIRFG